MTAKRVAVYCGSAPGSDPAYLSEAKALGKAIADAGLGLVYGGASVGLMGAVADAALAGGAEVVGVLPEILSGSEIAHRGLTRLEMVPTMHERKARMVKLADAFLMLPGGYGTLDEMMAGFLKPENRHLIEVAATAEEAVQRVIASELSFKS
jgi:uncharacterized protein (TIGR00730 family)